MPINDNTPQRQAGGAAQCRASDARRRATAAQQRASAARRRVRFAAGNGALWKILRFFENRTPAAWGALWYLLLSIIGVTYSSAFYSRFDDLHIFDFFGTSDFLLSAFQNVKILIIGIIATLIGIGILIYRAYDLIVYGAYKSDAKRKEARANWKTGILLFTILAGATFILPFLQGRHDSEARLQDEDRRVQVTLRQDSVQPGTRLPRLDRTLFLGTTSSFHFFYECEEPLNVRTDSKSEKRRLLIVPTANIASLEFDPGTVTCASSATPKADIACAESNPENGNDAPHVDLSHVIEAIAALDTTISNLKFNAIFKMESGNVTLDTTDVANAVTALNQTIAKFKPLIVFDPAQSAQIVQAVTTLNKIVRNFNPTTVPDLDKIVNAINTNTAKITTAIEGIKLPSEVRTRCVSGWKKVMTVGPFSTGEHECLEGMEKEDAKKHLGQLIDRNLFLSEANVFQRLMLIGRADITPLSEEKREYYGSNNGLAQSRAKWVRDKLVKQASNDSEKKALRERTILLSAGPLHVGQGGKDPTEIENRAKDRSVEVWACGDPKPEQASPSKDPPVH